MRHGTVDNAVEVRLTSHVADTGWEALSEAAQQQALRAMLWWIATAVEGTVQPDQATIRRYVADQATHGQALVFGSRLRTSPELAGLANGSAGKVYEHEDKYWVSESIGFAPGGYVVPAALMVAETRTGTTVQQVATAVAAAIDLEVRLQRVLGLEFAPGRSATASSFTFGNYGAAVAAAKVYGFDAEGILRALGLVHAQAAGNFQGHIEGRGVSIHCGFAVRNGVTAARLAALQMPAVTAPITGRAGLYATHYSHVTVHFDSITADLGTQFLGADLGYKAYPCGIVAHPALDAARLIRAELRGRTVKAIHVSGPTTLTIMSEPIEAKRAPQSGIQAQFSIPWGIACVLRDGTLAVEHSEPHSLQDPELTRLAGLVDITLATDTRGTTVRALLDDGTTIEPPTVMIARGHPRNPLTTSDMVEVLTRAAERAGLRRDVPDRIADLLFTGGGSATITNITTALEDFVREPELLPV